MKDTAGGVFAGLVCGLLFSILLAVWGVENQIKQTNQLIQTQRS